MREHHEDSLLFIKETKGCKPPDRTDKQTERPDGQTKQTDQTDGPDPPIRQTDKRTDRQKQIRQVDGHRDRHRDQTSLQTDRLCRRYRDAFHCVWRPPMETINATLVYPHVTLWRQTPRFCMHRAHVPTHVRHFNGTGHCAKSTIF